MYLQLYNNEHACSPFRYAVDNNFLFNDRTGYIQLCYIISNSLYFLSRFQIFCFGRFFVFPVFTASSFSLANTVLHCFMESEQIIVKSGF